MEHTYYTCTSQQWLESSRWQIASRAESQRNTWTRRRIWRSRPTSRNLWECCRRIWRRPLWGDRWMPGERLSTTRWCHSRGKTRSSRSEIIYFTFTLTINSYNNDDDYNYYYIRQVNRVKSFSCFHFCVSLSTQPTNSIKELNNVNRRSVIWCCWLS